MFGFLGATGPRIGQFDHAIEYVNRSFGDDVVRCNKVADSVAVAAPGDRGTLLGIAYSGGAMLAYVGAIWTPFPDPFEGSPLDDPDRTAAALLDRYFRNGDGFLDGIVGNFALCLVDGENDRLYLGRDAYGGPRVFYSESDDGVSFSTRLVDFSGPLAGRRSLDRSLEDFLLGFEFLPDDRTLAAGVKSVAKGVLLSWHNGERNERKIQPFDVEPGLLDLAASGDEEDVVSALHEAFVQSLKDQCPVEGKIGVLQGGFDSMLISSVLKGMGREVETFTFRYQEPGYTQEHVDEFQQLLKVRHNWVDIDAEVIRQGITNFAKHFNQPVGQPHYLIASAEAAKAMRQRGITHCLTGDGCDGLFLGYPTVFARARFIGRVSSIKWFLAPLIRLAGSSAWLEKRLGHPYRFFRNIGRVLERPMPARGHIAACTIDQTALNFLRTDHPSQEQQPEAILRDLASGLNGVEPLRLAYMGKGRVGLNAAKLEGISRLSGIPFSSPYLHPRMAAVAGCIPDRLNRPGDQEASGAGQDIGKYMFTRMVDRYELLPELFVHQRKMSPVTSPVDLWMWGSLRAELLNQMKNLPFASVRDDYLRSLLMPKRAERWFRSKVGISRQVTQAAGLLATYADFAKHFKKEDAGDATHTA